MLIGHYDLAKCPTNFDVVTFLLRLEAKRIELNEKNVQIEIEPGPWDGFRDDRARGIWPQDIEERRRLLHRVVIAMCELLPSCNRITNRKVRNTVRLDATNHFGFDEYTIPFKYFVEHAKAGIRPLRTAYELSKKRVITMTFRECEYWPDRNSKLSEWFLAASHFGLAYDIQIIRDNSVEPLALEKRSQIYRSAFCNMFISNGPAWLSIALDAPTVILRPFTDGGHILNSGNYFNSIGITADNQFPFNCKHQMIVCKDDTKDNIINAFEGFVNANA